MTRTGNVLVREMSLARTVTAVWMVILPWKQTTRMDVDNVSVMDIRQIVSRLVDFPVSTSHRSSALAQKNGEL